MGEGRLSPWLDVCIRPRATMRAIMDEDPDRHVVALIFAGFLVQVAAPSLAPSSEDGTGEWLLSIGLAWLEGLPIYFASVWIMASVFARTGRWLGGEASARQMRCVLAWSDLVPTLALPMGILVGVPLVIFLALIDVPAWDEFGDGALAIFIVVVLAWHLLVLLHGMAAANRFGMPRAIGALLLGVLVLLGGVVTLLFGLACILNPHWVGDRIAAVFS